MVMTTLETLKVVFNRSSSRDVFFLTKRFNRELDGGAFVDKDRELLFLTEVLVSLIAA